MSEATRIPELFGSLVFNERTMEQYVPQSAMDVWRGCLKSGQPLPLSAANEIADAMKTWALEHGATHFTHWFQPLSGVTAEKHDSFINNAGGGEPPCDFYDVTDERWDKIVKLNLYSPFYTIREVFPYMRDQKSGKIVNISSGYAIGGGERCANYASAKAGLIGLTTSIAREVAEFNINVNVIPVPTTDTPGLRAADFELVDDELPLIPLGRIAQPIDIANTALFLVSEASNYVTGQIVAPNGGKRMLV